MKNVQATVVKHTGSHYLLSELPGWELFPAVLRGKIRLKGSSATNPVAVGDIVDYERDGDDAEAAITSVHPRRNYLIRKSTNLSRQNHIIAANIDRAFLVVTLAFPEMKLPFLDRLLVTCEVYGVKPVIVLNKIDIFRGEFAEDFADVLENFHRIYELAGYDIVEVSAKTGEGIDICKNCIYLEEKEYDDEDYIASINFNEGMTCNLKCVYCTMTHGEISDAKPYDSYPIIKQLADNNYLRKGGFISVAGGEPTLGKNFDKMIDLFIEHEIQPIRVLTNGLIFSRAIERGLGMKYVNIMISVDSGSPEMYKWIKGVDAYDRVWENIRKYHESQNDPNYVKTKYIIIPTINDNKEEIIKFFVQNQKIGIGCVAFDIEMTWYDENKDNIPESLYELVDFTVEEAKRRNLMYEPVDRVVRLIQEIKKRKEINVKFRGHEL